VAMQLPWAAWYNTWLLIKFMPKGVVFSSSFLFWLCSFLAEDCIVFDGCISITALARNDRVPPITQLIKVFVHPFYAGPNKYISFAQH